MRREFLQLAQIYKGPSTLVNGWFVSEKLDGMRCLWDGGVTRGLQASQVPWNNSRKNCKATGLWSRYGKVIFAPDWWLDKLPRDICLDGELFTTRTDRQELMSIVKRENPDDRWSKVSFNAFDAPSPAILFADGEISNLHHKAKLRGCCDFWHLYAEDSAAAFKIDVFQDIYSRMTKRLAPWEGENFHIHPQGRLPFNSEAACFEIDDLLSQVTKAGGEGLMLRKPSSLYQTKRSKNLLKVKKYQDAEAHVLGYVWGQGKHAGRLGSLTVAWNKVVFQLSGFTDEERQLVPDGPTSPAPFDGQEVKGWHSPKFPIGSIITFQYRDVTTAGMPVEAKYWRRY